MILFLVLIVKHPSKADTGNIPESKHTGKEMKQENNIKKLHTERKHHKQNPESFLRHRSRKGIKMKKQLLEAFNEMNNTNFHHLSNIKIYGYSKKEILDAYLRYEGIAGYTEKILSVIDIINSL